jgi:F0F1-type ATP synthase membrane subunit c/vacuolar-type H+-ATPase subunit K
MGMSAMSATEGIGRQPSMSSDLFRTMLIGQGATSTPPTFALVVGIVLLFATPDATSLIEGVAGLAAGISIGAASFASGVGSAYPAHEACLAIARQPRLRRPFTTLMLIAQALSQTPLIFGLLISFMLIFMVKPNPDAGIVELTAVLSAGICMGFGAMGPSVGSGIAGESTFIGIRYHRDPELAIPLLTRVMLLGMAVAQSTSIYAMVIALVLIGLVL